MGNNQQHNQSHITIQYGKQSTIQSELHDNTICETINNTTTVPWSKPEGLEVRLPIWPAMKSEATNEKNRYSLKRVPNYF